MRRLRTLLLTATAMCSALTVGACDDAEPQPIAVTQQEITIDLESNLNAHIVGMADALVFMDNSVLANDFSVLMASAMTGASPDPVDPTLPPVDPPAPEPMNFDQRQAATDLVRAIMDSVFSPDFVEEKTSTSVTFKLPADAFCMSDTITTSPTGEELIESSLDADCAASYADMVIRLRVTSMAAGNLDIELLVGEARHAPLRLEIYRGKLALELDLAALKATINTVMTAQGQTDVELPEVMQGRLRAELVKNGDKDFTASFSVLSAVSVRFQVDGELIALDLAPKSPAFSARFDGVNKQISLELDAGAIDLSIPASLMESSSEMTCTIPIDGTEPICEPVSSSPSIVGTYALHIGGVSGRTVFDGTADQLIFENLGLGDSTSTFSINDLPLVTVDLNPNAQRRLGAVLTSLGDSTGGVKLEVSPLVDLAVALTMKNIADQVTDMEPWMLDELFGVLLDGTAPAVAIREGGVEVLSGNLKLSSKQTTVEVAAGMCLLQAPPSDIVASHPFEELLSGACE